MMRKIQQYAHGAFPPKHARFSKKRGKKSRIYKEKSEHTVLVGEMQTTGG